MGDKLVSLNGRSVSDMDHDAVLGTLGAALSLTIEVSRPNAKVVEASLVRSATGKYDVVYAPIKHSHEAVNQNGGRRGSSSTDNGDATLGDEHHDLVSHRQSVGRLSVGDLGDDAVFEDGNSAQSKQRRASSSSKNPSELKTVTITRGANGLGLSLLGADDNEPPVGVFVTAIDPEVKAQHKDLHEGMLVLRVKGQDTDTFTSLEHRTLSQAIAAIRSAGNPVTFVLEDSPRKYHEAQQTLGIKTRRASRLASFKKFFNRSSKSRHETSSASSVPDSLEANNGVPGQRKHSVPTVTLTPAPSSTSTSTSILGTLHETGPERTITLERGASGFGISLMGAGAQEEPVGVFISAVDPTGPASHKDLSEGLQILRVKGQHAPSFTSVEALSLPEAGSVISQCGQAVTFVVVDNPRGYKRACEFFQASDSKPLSASRENLALSVKFDDTIQPPSRPTSTSSSPPSQPSSRTSSLKRQTSYPSSDASSRTRTFTLKRGVNGLGISITGAEANQKPCGIFISAVDPALAAANKDVVEGLQIVSIKGQLADRASEVDDCTLDMAASLIRSAGTVVTFVVTENPHGYKQLTESESKTRRSTRLASIKKFFGKSTSQEKDAPRLKTQHSITSQSKAPVTSPKSASSSVQPSRSSVSSPQEKTITLTRGSNGLGVSLMGADDDEEPLGIFITSIDPSVLAANKDLRVGMQILRAKGPLSDTFKSFEKSSLNQAASVIRAAGNVVTMVVIENPEGFNALTTFLNQQTASPSDDLNDEPVRLEMTKRPVVATVEEKLKTTMEAKVVEKEKTVSVSSLPDVPTTRFSSTKAQVVSVPAVTTPVVTAPLPVAPELVPIEYDDSTI